MEIGNIVKLRNGENITIKRLMVDESNKLVIGYELNNTMLYTYASNVIDSDNPAPTIEGESTNA